jgi:hypothetical protein
MDGTPSRHAHSAPHQASADDDYKAAANEVEESVDYKQYMPKLKAEHKTLKRLVKVLLLLVVVAGLGIGAYVFGARIATKKQPVAKAKTTVPTDTVKSSTKQYTSNYQDLSFTYPTDWKVAETTDVITATSPAMKLTGYDRQTVTGEIVFRVRDKNVVLSEFSSGNATAALNSQIVTYAAPAAGQRASTYASFLNYAGSKGNGIDGIYVTGDTGYQTGQAAPESDLAPIDPVISITFDKCANAKCTGTPTPLTIATSSWKATEFSKPLLAILASLAIS